MVSRSEDSHTEWRVINKETGAKMGYRYLGKTGVKVSILGYGNWLTSDANTEESQALVTESIKRCFDAGVNFFDTAEMYACGLAESQMGKALKELNVPRKDYVLSTKMWFCGNQPNDRFLSRKHIIEGLRNSLKRLQTNYVDIVFAHRPDFETPLEEQVRAFSWCIDQGMAHYWGTSEWPASRFEQACAIAEKYHLHAPQVEQCQYNMLERERMELEYRPLFETRQMGTTIWSPLYGGALSGKYNDGSLPEGSRGQAAVTGTTYSYLAPRWNKYFGPSNVEKTKTCLAGIADVAKDLGCS